jgi:hypothetical protein
MSDSFVLELLRSVLGDISRVKTDIIELKELRGFLEGGYASLFRRVDRIGGEVERIKTRLNIAGASV